MKQILVYYRRWRVAASLYVCVVAVGFHVAIYHLGESNLYET